MSLREIMSIKRIVLWLLSGLYLSLSLMSPFMYSSIFKVWRNVIDLYKLNYAGPHYLRFLLAFVLIFGLTYVFANSSKHVIKTIVSILDISIEETKNEMDRISLLASFFTIFFFVSSILEEQFIQGFREDFQRVAIIMSMLLMSLAVNHHLDKKFRNLEFESGGDGIHFLISLPIFVLNGILLFGLFGFMFPL